MTLVSSLSVPVIASVVGIFISCITLYHNRRQDRLKALVEVFKLLRMFHVPRSTFSRLVDSLTEEELSKFAVTIAMKDFVDMGLLLRGEFYSYTILKHLGKLVTNISLLDYLFIFE
ncbi:MAG: hypothetical protein WCF23_04720 [Candidatus Nitrosopolaris sp.]